MIFLGHIPPLGSAYVRHSVKAPPIFCFHFSVKEKVFSKWLSILYFCWRSLVGFNRIGAVAKAGHQLDLGQLRFYYKTHTNPNRRKSVPYCVANFFFFEFFNKSEWPKSSSIKFFSFLHLIWDHKMDRTYNFLYLSLGPISFICQCAKKLKKSFKKRKETLSSANTIIEQFVVAQVESIFTCSICNSDISPTVLLTLTRASSWERCTLARMESPLETLLGLSSLRNINKSSFQNAFLSPLFLS